MDGRGNLKDLREQQNAWIAAWRGWTNDVGPHGSGRRSKVYVFGIDNDHVSSGERWLNGSSLLPRNEQIPTNLDQVGGFL
jgi:hypothetical protein